MGRKNLKTLESLLFFTRKKKMAGIDFLTIYNEVIFDQNTFQLF
ncbi:hypothetical protein BVRB_5g117610 [Beta vulgaris subsp. vulgaris]|nr:hypothetical protein BVRB_5g117610 [Beta vulgaris subsp. vulgaris]